MLVVHTGNASCHVLSFCFVPPLPNDTRVASPEAPGPSADPWSSWLHLTRVPARSWTVSSLSLWLVSHSHIQLQEILATVSRLVWTGRSFEAWALEARKTPSFEEFVCFSKKVHQHLTIRVTGSWGYLLSHRTLLQRGERERRGLEPHPADPSKCSAPMGAALLASVGRVGPALYVHEKGIAGSTSWSTKPWGAKSRVALSPETNFKGETHLPFFRVSTHLFSSSSSRKKNKMFNN